MASWAHYDLDVASQVMNVCYMVRARAYSVGYTVVNKKIVGVTQEFAEKEFVKSLTRLGVGDKANVASMRSFDSFLEWALENLEERERFTKTGWSSWPRLREGVRPE